MSAPSPLPYDTLVFTHRAVDGRTIRLGYALTARSGARLELEETLTLPGSLGELAPPHDPAVARALAGLHVAAGTSYWKTCIPAISFDPPLPLSDDDAALWNDVYTLGMGEFFYRNEIDPTGRGPFRSSSAAAAPAPARAAAGPALLLWGGGKDSAVSHEILSEAGEPHDLISFGRTHWAWIAKSAAAAGAAHHAVERRLDPKLAELNAAGALNGHVPVNAFLAFAGLLAAALSGRPAVIASNESSASFGNTSWCGLDVNHQWSKSLAFERSARRWIARNLGGAPDYFSLLRPLSELRIVKAFSTHPRYFDAVTSCNANFRQESRADRRWCLGCPKCVFVSLMARPWLDDATYHALFAGDPIADPENTTYLEALLGIRGVKPFECVGTPDETAVALGLAKLAGHDLPHGAMTLFHQDVMRGGFDFDLARQRVLARGTDHELSPPRLAQLDAYLDRH